MSPSSSDNDLASETSSNSGEWDWEWLYADDAVAQDEPRDGESRRSSKRRRKAMTETIVGARLGQFECYQGDCVILRSEGSAPAWLAIIDKFIDGEDGEKTANFVWFSNEKEIRNKAKKRTDFLQVCTHRTSNSYSHLTREICRMKCTYLFLRM